MTLELLERHVDIGTQVAPRHEIGRASIYLYLYPGLRVRKVNLIGRLILHTLDETSALSALASLRRASGLCATYLAAVLI